MADWIERDGALHREFKFRDFSEAFAFMTRVAMLAERENHHPEWSNVYSQVAIKLTTHDDGNIVTDHDRKFAGLIDVIAGETADLP
jgi:4a-hydroxytetrahydrobiopterin dehydratase